MLRSDPLNGRQGCPDRMTWRHELLSFYGSRGDEAVFDKARPSADRPGKERVFYFQSDERESRTTLRFTLAVKSVPVSSKWVYWYDSEVASDRVRLYVSSTPAA